ncbi:hypothetical protein OIU77_008896 [Salix suchowensis]|uniref:Uncharacterized protein n=1 Tax=Salix suchowensis TaxID=1278906 RepID=A0ABQ9AD07_9ROSI|nr:hypothetical protein OIU77_008896 [Salix suchowensis]
MQKLPYSLVEAAVSVAYTHFFILEVDNYIDMAVQFLRLADHAYCQDLTLMLSNAVREKLPCFENLPNFLNLTRLEIEASGDYCWFTLTVQTNEPPKWPILLHVNSSVNPKWRNPGFVHAPEHENALVLEKMAIRFGRGMIRSPEDRVVRRLTECQMGSSACRITFSP